MIIVSNDLLRILGDRHQDPETPTAGPKIEFLKKLDFGSQELAFMLTAAIASFQTEEYQRAIDIYHSIELFAPSYGKPVSGRGMAHHCLGQLDQAEEAYRRAIDLDGKDQEAHLYLGELLSFDRNDKQGGRRHLGVAKALGTGTLAGARAAVMLERAEADPNASKAKLNDRLDEK